MIALFHLFAVLIFAHMLADYPLQGDFLSKAKNKWSPVTGVPWALALASHCAIQAGFVMLVTDSLGFAVAEFFAHAVIDHNKCAQRISFAQDQFLHVACKLVYVALVALHIGGAYVV